MAKLDPGVERVLIIKMGQVRHRKIIQAALAIRDQQAEDRAGEGLRTGPDVVVSVNIRAFPDQPAIANDHQFLRAVGAEIAVHIGHRRAKFRRVDALGLGGSLAPLLVGESGSRLWL